MSLFCETYLAIELYNCTEILNQVNNNDSSSLQQWEVRFGGSLKKGCQWRPHNNQNEPGWFGKPKVNTFSSYHYPATLVLFSFNFPKVISEAFQNVIKSSSSLFSEWTIFKYHSFRFQPSRRQKSTDLSSPCCTSYTTSFLWQADFQELTCGFENSIFHCRLVLVIIDIIHVFWRCAPRAFTMGY